MLTLSTKGRYATRIMVFLAMNRSTRPVRKQDVAAAEGISPDYVEQILIKLKTGGLVESRRGVAGGFVLACEPSKVTVRDILEAVEGPIALVPCLKEDCQRASACATRGVWNEATETLRSFFAGITLAQLAKKSEGLAQNSALTFQI
jgi:Rrf2 family transcriptional regulator, cysteine metabolism repressor